ncbi:MAG: hypothetical protein OXU45_02770 [Candidatus Melainabacteria bacterium]|nr:hypothetical protein [Candidatus Melainabacteria bacterium]
MPPSSHALRNIQPGTKTNLAHATQLSEQARLKQIAVSELLRASKFKISDCVRRARTMHFNLDFTEGNLKGGSLNLMLPYKSDSALGLNPSDIESINVIQAQGFHLSSYKSTIISNDQFQELELIPLLWELINQIMMFDTDDIDPDSPVFASPSPQGDSPKPEGPNRGPGTALALPVSTADSQTRQQIVV